MPVLNIEPKHAYSAVNVAVHNPHDKPVEELPVIYGFNNGGGLGFMSAILLSQDGTVLGSHMCSNEHFMIGDLGVREGTRPDRHEDFKKHYPDGYRMEFIGYEDFKGHPGINAAAELAVAMQEAEKAGDPQ